MLLTPLGEIELSIDNKSVPYDAIKYERDRTCKDLGGRYFIKVGFVPDGQPHEICCCIKDYQVSDRDGIESGERLELKSFYQGSCKVSIGTQCDDAYFGDGTRVGNSDYDTEYTKNGIKYVIRPNTETTVFIFGIAWIDNVDDRNDVQTWYGADPTLMC